MTEANVLTRMLHAVDLLDWPTVKDSVTDPVRMDYTSLWGGEPETVAADELISRWTEFTDGLAATQHLTGPLLVDGDRVETHVIAHHWRPDNANGDAWTVYGHYTARLADGKVSELILHTYRAEGAADLPRIDGKRAPRHS